MLAYFVDNLILIFRLWDTVGPLWAWICLCPRVYFRYFVVRLLSARLLRPATGAVSISYLDGAFGVARRTNRLRPLL